jgi:hypothetical protein
VNCIVSDEWEPIIAPNSLTIQSLKVFIVLINELTDCVDHGGLSSVRFDGNRILEDMQRYHTVTKVPQVHNAFSLVTQLQRTLGDEKTAAGLFKPAVRPIRPDLRVKLPPLSSVGMVATACLCQCRTPPPQNNGSVRHLKHRVNEMIEDTEYH